MVLNVKELEIDHTKMPAKILKCVDCHTHEYQDAKYGIWRRVMNPIKSSLRTVKSYRCTVCGKETSI